jgi:1-aminocyclopropane-1-carboxylate deaminase
MLPLLLDNYIEPIVGLHNNNVDISVLRLDKISVAMSGNKYFKLKYLLQEAVAVQATTIVSYGGVWSNHIAALAAVCKQLQLQSIGYIRSDEALTTTTLQKAKANGMQLIYCTRAEYALIKTKQGLQQNKHYYIPEGGATTLGVKGASEIMQLQSIHKYTHIITAMGTGTTFAGIVQAALPHQKIIGINALKGGFIQKQDIEHYLTNNNWEVLNDFHWGGFAKYNNALIEFMNTFYITTKIETDIVYTAKVFYAVTQLLEQKYFEQNNNILIIHTGGLQGNQSLTKETLLF